MNLELLSIAAAVVALGFVAYLIKKIDGSEPGNEQMQEISSAISEGAQAFLKREYT